MMILHLI